MSLSSILCLYPIAKRIVDHLIHKCDIETILQLCLVSRDVQDSVMQRLQLVEKGSFFWEVFAACNYLHTSINSGCTIHRQMIYDLKEYFCWTRLSSIYRLLTWSDFDLYKFEPFIDWSVISRSYGLDLNFEFLFRYKERLDWKKCGWLGMLTVDEQQARALDNYIDISYYVVNNKVSYEFLEDYADRFDWYQFPYKKYVSTEFIDRFFEQSFHRCLFEAVLESPVLIRIPNRISPGMWNLPFFLHSWICMLTKHSDKGIDGQQRDEELSTLCYKRRRTRP